jgi:hypothetical protein
MAQRFGFAPVGSMAFDLIQKFHPHLEGIPIVFFFFYEEKKKIGITVLGYAAKLNPVERHLMGEILADSSKTGEICDWYVGPQTQERRLAEGFAVCIYADNWSEWKRHGRIDLMRALLDHELCRCTVEEDDDGNVMHWIVGHDIEEFNAIIERHGDWLGEVKKLTKAQALHVQLSLDLVEGTGS